MCKLASQSCVMFFAVKALELYLTPAHRGYITDYMKHH